MITRGSPMAEDDVFDRLSRIQTCWTRMLSGADRAEKDLLLRYHGAAFRYVLAMVQDAAVAEELTQEFAVRFMAGQYQQVDRQRGRFRDFLKGCLRNLTHDHWRKQQRDRARVAGDVDFDPLAPPEPQGNDSFEANWREELLARTWQALATFEAESGKPYCTRRAIGARAEQAARCRGRAANAASRPRNLRGPSPGRGRAHIA
jgi:DNA-directed RNA polymerase specialized sigma24 family protein